MQKNRFLSVRSIVPGVVAVSINFFIYFLCRFLAGDAVHYNFTTALDRAIPLVPWMVTIYWVCYLFWAVNYTLVFSGSREKAKRFFVAHCIAEAVCGLCFLFLPTTMVRPEIEGSSLFVWMLKLTYWIDKPDNLLPSIHCFASWLSWIGVRKEKRVPKWYRIFSLCMACAVCVSTLTVKQHLIADVISGVLLAEIAYFAAGWITKPHAR